MKIELSPKNRRNIAAAVFILSIFPGWPISWFIADLSDEWFKRIMTFVSFLGITFIAVDWWQTSDVRTEQEEE